MEGQGSEDADIVSVTEIVQESIATEFVISSVTGADEDKVVDVTITLDGKDGEAKIVTEEVTVDVNDGDNINTVTIAIEESDGDATVVTRTIEIDNVGSDQALAATKTVKEGAV